MLSYILINYRWVFVCLFLLPISFLYDLWMYIRNVIVFKLNSAPRNHDKKVRTVQKQVNEWIKSGSQLKMCTSRPGWQTISFRRPKYKDFSFKININLVDILEINDAKKVVRVEPMVTMKQLTASLNPLRWTIPVLPEMDDLTVGGLVMGTGIESSSHIYGLFQNICESYELVLPDGSLMKCSKDEHSEIFYSVPWSYGTIGFLTAVEIKLIPARKYLKLHYTPTYSLDETVGVFEEAISNPANEFIEGLMFSDKEGVIMTGNMTDEYEPGQVNNIGRWHKPWFFTHVRDKLKYHIRNVEYIPLQEYYHRHTKSIFWELKDIIPFGNNILFRWLLGWMMPPKVSLLKLTQTKAITELYENNHIIQDILVPINTLKKSVMLFEKLVKVYPLWLCPFILPKQPGMMNLSRGESEMYVDIGLYGVPQVSNFKPTETIRAIEKFVISNQGFQMLYADTYTTRNEFRRMFDHTLYDKVRKQLQADRAFPEVYDKVSRAARI